MSIIDSSTLLASGTDGYQISRSLRFNSADSAFLSRAFGSDGGSTWTISCWLKRSEVDTRNFSFTLMHAGAYPNPYEHIHIGSNSIIYYNDGGASAQGGRVTAAVFRDCSAWYHIVCVRQGTSQFKIYVNGVEQAASSNTNPSASYALNKAATMYIGQNNNYDGGGTKYSAGYLTEYHFVSGQALTPSSFGETDTITGVWKPKKYAGTYGTNGFYLNFSDNSGTTSTTLGKDSSGNSNNWTPNNFSVTAGAGNDSLIDTPTPYADGGNGRGNYATLNPLVVIPRGTISNGNLNYLSGSTASHGSAAGSFTLPASGKWYWEVMACNNSGGSGNNEIIGVANIQNNPQLPAAGSEIGGGSRGDYGYRSDGNKYNNGSQGSYGATYTNGDVIGVAWSSDDGTLTFYKNGASQGTAFSSIIQVEGKFAPASSNAESSNGDTYNFGQRAFAYTPPSGFVALNTQNLPEPSIKKPSSYMDVVTWTGDGVNNRQITGLNFSPDTVWLKSRSQAYDALIVDAVRGSNLSLTPSSTSSETTNNGNGYISALGSSGFTLTQGGSSIVSVNQNTATYVAWCWDESATPGFDIVTYTGNGTGGTTINHSLGVAPSMVIIKSRSVGTNWYVWHKRLTQPDYQIYLNLTDAQDTSVLTFLNDKAPTSTVFELPGAGYGSNNSSATYVAYLWSEVAGFSKFGSYTGNGSSDGPFVFCGFQPKFLLVKSSSSGYDWFIFDDTRNTYNAVDLALFPNVSGAESGPNTYSFDFLSNGFKLRNTQLNLNGSGNTYIFAAFAEFPAKYSLAR